MAANRWHNKLPTWIQADLAEHPLKQGPRATLQAIADRCDAPKSDAELLLVAVGGEELVKECGCSSSTFWRHLSVLVERGYVVELSRGGGRLASVYGVPGRQGQLDPYRAPPDAVARRWQRADTDEIRRLVSQNGTLAGRPLAGEATENATPAHAEQNGSPPELGRQAPQFEALPSPSSPPAPALEPSALPAPGSGQLRLGDDAKKGLRKRLETLGFGTSAERARLVATEEATVADALVRLDKAIADGQKNGKPVQNPGGLLRTFLEQNVSGTMAGLVSDMARAMSPSYGPDHEAKIREQCRLIREGRL